MNYHVVSRRYLQLNYQKLKVCDTHFNAMYIHHDSREQTCMCRNISFFDLYILYIHFVCITLFIRYYYASNFLNWQK